jgi:hypothetical protein
MHGTTQNIKNPNNSAGGKREHEVLEASHDKVADRFIDGVDEARVYAGEKIVFKKI